ncbi:PaaI family thioesterase [Bacillus sp. FJAT-27251]|uniref:PaaI family thioesterase n=1 Tax=Bacillus sp. FJAT-27251 TaxID=1684142 RepID=UPI0006A75848|nr:PaaI family thioesterase [Bacillus sp. FJAT-27251]
MAYTLPEELVEVIKDYEKGPHWKLMNFTVQSIEKGKVSLKLPSREEFNNIKGTIHGGILAALLDTTMGMAARTQLTGTPVTIQLNIQYLKPAINEPLYSQAKIIETGKTTCFIEGHIYNEQSERIAFSTGTFKVS